jgi:hypothetical protein
MIISLMSGPVNESIDPQALALFVPSNDEADRARRTVPAERYENRSAARGC